MKHVTFRQLRHLWPIYVLLLPALALIGTFSYSPAAQGVWYSFFRWDGDEVREFVGLANFARALRDPILGRAFLLVMVFIVANFVKMVPSIVTATVVHRLASGRARYLYRVAFVIPMIIPEMVWLLIWQYFYDPNVGVLNSLLLATGGLDALRWLDRALPQLAGAIIPLRDALLGRVFGGLWGFGLFGAMLLALQNGLKGMARGWLWWLGLLAGGLLLWGPLRGSLLVAAGLGAAEAMLRLPRGRLAVRRLAMVWLAAFGLLVLTSGAWTEPTRAFVNDAPSWLGNKNLIVPALVFWGFPWISVVGVLLYLSGLGNIDQSVYEAADIDGCGPFSKFWNIELPLIMTQVRLNLVLMVIGTLTAWTLLFILLTDTGGPGGAGMLPGLYMFRMAFTEQQVGYACAIGLLLFFLIVYLTFVNNRYVRVEK